MNASVSSLSIQINFHHTYSDAILIQFSILYFNLSLQWPQVKNRKGKKTKRQKEKCNVTNHKMILELMSCETGNLSSFLVMAARGSRSSSSSASAIVAVFVAVGALSVLMLVAAQDGRLFGWINVVIFVGASFT